MAKVLETRNMKIRFAHIADCHLGAWHARLQEMNLAAFKQAIDSCIKERVDFVLITGDLFDTAIPPIDILKEATSKLKQLKDSGIECYIIAGSHDFSVSGKTFLDVLEKAGLLSNVSVIRETGEGKIELELIEKENLIIAGLSGRKAGLETGLISKDIIDGKKLNSNKLKILALHTTITEAINEYNPKSSEFMDSVDASKLPDGFDYYALGHIHFPFERKIENKLIVYPGPLFPNNFAEIEELKAGSFCFVEFDNGKINVRREKIDLNVESSRIDASGKDPQQISNEIIKKIENLQDKIITARVSGKLNGHISDIQFVKINEEAEKNNCIFLKNTSDLESPEFKTEFDIKAKDIEEIEKEIVEKFCMDNQSEFNRLINILIKNLNIEKQEGETTSVFEKRMFQDIEKIIGIK